MNVNAEIKALDTVIGRVREQAERGEVPEENIPAIAGYLDRRLKLVKGQIRTDELCAFQEILEASGYES